MANRILEYRRGSDQLLTVTIDNINLADGGGVKTVTANITTQLTPDSTTSILSGITVTQTGDPSKITIQPDSTMKALSAGIYTIEFVAADSSGNDEYTEPWGILIIKG